MKKTMALVLALLLLLAPAAMAMASEEVVMIPGAEWEIPATITLPEGDGPFPFVVMYHGTGSNREEAGNGYQMMARLLAATGIASARFDFVGSGDSKEDYVNYTWSSGVADGDAVIAYMQGLPQIDPERVGVLGWSQGGSVAMLAAARNPVVKSLCTWAGAVDMSGYMADQYEDAKENGFTVMKFDWRTPLNLSVEWFDEARATKIPEELKDYKGAALVMAGSLDDVVPLTDMDLILESVGGETKEKVIIEGADHTFNVFSGDLDKFNELAGKTMAWFQKTL